MGNLAEELRERSKYDDALIVGSEIRAALQEQRQEIQRLTDTLEQLQEKHDAWRSTASAAASDVMRLTAALRKYGHHDNDCAWLWDGEDPCDCGYCDALGLHQSAGDRSMSEIKPTDSHLSDPYVLQLIEALARQDDEIERLSTEVGDRREQVEEYQQREDEIIVALGSQGLLPSEIPDKIEELIDDRDHVSQLLLDAGNVAFQQDTQNHEYDNQDRRGLIAIINTHKTSLREAAKEVERLQNVARKLFREAAQDRWGTEEYKALTDSMVDDEIAKMIETLIVEGS